MAEIFSPRFCASCGGALVATLGPQDGAAPYYCTVCNMPVYEDPKVATAVIVHTERGIVLLKRAQRDGAHGKWILPGGHVDRGEVVSSAAVREVAEETGLVVELDRLVGVYSYERNPWVLVVYEGRAVGGELKPSKEALDMAAFTRKEVPWQELGYTSTKDALTEALGRNHG